MSLDKIKDRIAKLLAMAANNGNEHEALLAAERARKLMDQYQLSEMDATQTDNRFGEVVNKKGYRFAPKWTNWLAVAVGKFNDCQVDLIRADDRNLHLRWRGYSEDVQVALSMFEYFSAVIANECSKDQLARGYTRYYARVGTVFKEAMASRLGDRLAAMLAARDAETKDSTTGTSLVVRKATAVAEHFGAIRYEEVTHKHQYTEEQMHAYWQGIAAGDGVVINAIA